MSALPRPRPASAPRPLVLLGTGAVGRALLARLQRGREAGWPLRLHALANTRQCWVARGEDGLAPDALPAAAPAQPPDALLAGLRQAVVLDATASEALAARHADWLARGFDVVSANKRGLGDAQARWDAIHAAQAHGGARYGDAATVGAGLPVLRSLRALRAGGDRIHAIAGVLSGSLAWLCERHDGSRPFSHWLWQARAEGYAEPDPREDLSGADVRRKLLILARSAGWRLEPEAVRIAPLLPPALARMPLTEFAQAAARLDLPWARRLARARAAGGRLAYVARLDAQGARAALEILPAGDPLLAGAGTDNRVAIWADRYPRQPLRIHGPGAGAEVTAAAMLDEALALAAPRGWP